MYSRNIIRMYGHHTLDITDWSRCHTHNYTHPTSCACMGHLYGYVMCMYGTLVWVRHTLIGCHRHVWDTCMGRHTLIGCHTHVWDTCTDIIHLYGTSWKVLVSFPDPHMRGRVWEGLTRLKCPLQPSLS